MISMVLIRDYLGQIHVSHTHEKSIQGYFNTVAHLRDLCNRDQFSEMVSGYYINASPKFLGSARLSYFVNPTMTDSESAVIDFLRRNRIKLDSIGSSPSSIVITKGYNWPQEKEQKLRNFLVDYTMIGLEMMKNNLHHSRCLMASYRFQIRWASLDISSHFKKSLEILSSTYKSWNNKKKELFLSALAEWPLRRQVDWAHFMVYLILPYDDNSVFLDPNYSKYKNHLSFSEINHKVKRFGLQIEHDWSPEDIS